MLEGHHFKFNIKPDQVVLFDLKKAGNSKCSIIYIEVHLPCKT